MAIMQGGGMKIDRFPIEIDVRPFKVNADLLRVSTFRLARQFGDMTIPLIRSIKKVVIPSMIRNYMLQGRPSWQPLAESTIERRMSKGFPRILLDTEKLARISTSWPIWRINRTEANMEALDAVVPYAKYHQSGTANMPARPFALLQLKDVENIIIIFDDWIREVTGARDFWPYWEKPSGSGPGEFV